MKKHIALTLGLVFVSGSAFASKARLEALGEDAFGSQFLSDSRNIFLNAAHLNYHKDFVTYEWGKSDLAGTDTDSTTTPHAEGGAFKSSGNMAYGLYFGAENNISNMWRAASSVGTEENVVDFFVAGDAGVQWGASLTYTNTKDDATDSKQSAMRARIGVISGNIEGFANIGLSNKSEVGTAEFEGKTSFDLGATYNMGDMAYMARVASAQGETVNSSVDRKYQRTQVGAAKSYKLNDKATMWASAWYKMESGENTGNLGAGEVKQNQLPVSIALEVSAQDWLVLRGSVSQNVLIGEKEADNGDKSSITGTKVAAGAGLVFGDLTVDGMIGNNSATTVAGSDTSAASGTLRTDTLMSRVSMTYRF